MDTNQIYLATETNFGYKLVKANKLIDWDKYNVVSSRPDEYYLERKSNYKIISLDNIGQYNFTNCKINDCIINDGSYQVKSLIKLLTIIYKLVNDKEQIIKYSKLNIQPIENKTKGYENIKKLGISYPKPDSNLAIYEIINQCESLNIKLNLKMELADKRLVKLKIN